MNCKLYSYDGPVEEFGRCISNRWHGETWATSKAKARSNLTYQCKKELNRVANTRITLPGDITEAK